VMVITIMVFLVGCKGNEAAHYEPTTAKVEVKEKAQTNTGHHLCGAPTTKGQPCTRRVSDVHGKDAKCWQHRG